MGEGCAAIQKGGGLPVWGWASLMTHSAGSVTNQSTAFKYEMASEPYRYTRYLKKVMASFPYVKIYFFTNAYSIESKMVLNYFSSLVQDKILGRYAKTGFSQ
jgi:hypothetical protein